MTSELKAYGLLHSLQQAGLFPTPVIPETFKPSIDVSVAFGEKSVAAGNLFRVSEVANAPEVSFTSEVGNSTLPPIVPITPEDSTLIVVNQIGAKDDARYTLILTDPDAPTPDDPKFAYWRHWVVSDIEATKPASSGKTLTQYLGPGPKDDSRPHRYLFLVYRQPEDFKLQKEDVGGEEFVERRSFQVKEWTEKHDLQLVGLNWMLGAGDGWKE